MPIKVDTPQTRLASSRVHARRFGQLPYSNCGGQ